jgi:hypothetical protein
MVTKVLFLALLLTFAAPAASFQITDA